MVKLDISLFLIDIPIKFTLNALCSFYLSDLRPLLLLKADELLLLLLIGGDRHVNPRFFDPLINALADFGQQ